MIPGLGRFPTEGNGYPLQDSCQENPMNRGDNPWDHIESEMTVLHAAALFCILPYSTYQGLESDFSFFFFKGKNVWCFKKAAKKTPY